jgi:glycerophosphoryl diester phosphodiesterase
VATRTGALALAACASLLVGASQESCLLEHFEHHPAFARVGARFPVIVGHGGSRDLCARNTLECYALSIELGARAMEADLQVLGDGTLVMFNDDDTLEQTGEQHDLRAIDLETMKGLDAGWAFTPDGGQTHPLRGQGLQVPTLRELLDAFPELPVLLDVKPEIPEMATALLDFAENELTDSERERVYIEEDDEQVVAALRALDPAPRVAFSDDERLELVTALASGLHPRELAALDPTWIDLPALLPNALAIVVRWSRAHGHVLTASTVDDSEEMLEILSDLKVDGLVTNRPDRMHELLFGS